jgi:hypothetical protein
MSWQLSLVALIVATAALYLLRRALRTWIGSPSSCTGCRSASTLPTKSSTFIPAEQLTIREREPR